MGTRLYFQATDGSNGFELWAYETTNSSTWQVADIRSGSGSGSANGITAVGTRIYFVADDGSSGQELWVHESINGSTWRVEDIYSGYGNGFAADISPGNGHGEANEIIVMGAQIYFEASDGVSGFELHMMEIEHTITFN
jgi:ELWxxDGT repeat protein